MSGYVVQPGLNHLFTRITSVNPFRYEIHLGSIQTHLILCHIVSDYRAVLKIDRPACYLWNITVILRKIDKRRKSC